MLFNKRCPPFFLCGVFCLNFVFLQAEDGQKNAQELVNVYEYIASMHLPTLSQEETAEIERNNEIERYNAELKDKWFNIGGTVKIPALGNVETLRQAYLFFAAQKTKGDNNTEVQFFDRASLEDLNIFTGSKLKMQRHVTALFEPYLHTAIGKVQLQKMLCQPISDIKVLNERQKKVKQLLGDARRLDKLNSLLQGLTLDEKEFLWFWKNMSKATFDQLEMDAIPKIFPLPQSMKKIPCAPELMSKSTILLLLACNPLTWVVGASFFMGFSTSLNILRSSLQLAFEDPGLAGFWITYCLLIISMYTYQDVKIITGYNAATNAIHAKMNSVARFMARAQELLGSDAFANLSKESELLVQLLGTSTFKDDPSFFSYKGRAIAAFNLLGELKTQFVSLLERLGQLDAYVAIARFMRVQEINKHGKYCFPTYVQNDRPYININQYWHPFLDPEIVVTNDIELGGNVSRDVIVTGPNAAGKTTALKSITLAIALAQTLGIAPAYAMTFTPFKIINTYMDIADDTGSESLFQAEMHRAARLIELVKKQTGNNFIFVVMDELFTATNPLEGKSAAYGVVRKLLEFNNSVLIFVTHYKELTELENETNGAIRNFKVWVEKSEINGRITYPYKMVPGIADQTIALDLLAEEGFDKDILDNSYAMLHRLKHAAV